MRSNTQIRLLRDLHLLYWPVALLVGLSLSETLLGAQVGKVTGGFYSALLDERDRRHFEKVLLQAAGWFAAAACVKACGTFLAQQLALTWRNRYWRVLALLLFLGMEFFEPFCKCFWNSCSASQSFLMHSS